MKNIKGLSGAIYNTEYAMICQPMTRIDTSIAVCFFLLLFAVKIRQWLMEMKQIIAVGRVENDARECQMNATYCHIFKNAWIGTYTDYILAEQKVENIKNK